jgi:SAM-dependent methyltransferase
VSWEEIMRALLKFALAALFLVAPALHAADEQYYANTGLTLDGIGKSYMGREIAQVMGYQGASWLERPARAREEGTDKLIALLGLKPTDVVADIGAGTGYFSFRLAKAVPQGKVYAQDIQEEMLAVIQRKKDTGEGANVVPTLGGIVDPRLPANSIDLILMVDVYHEFSEPQAMLRRMRDALKPTGRLVLFEYRKEDPSIPIRPDHKMSVAEARMEVEAEGFTLTQVDERLPRQHILVFTKK